MVHIFVENTKHNPNSIPVFEDVKLIRYKNNKINTDENGSIVAF